MTVKELKDNLAFYDDDAEVVFEVDCDIEPKNITETKYGCTVYLNSRLKPTFIGTIHGNCYIDLGLEDDG